MKRSIGLLIAVLVATAPASAQITPGDAGAGVQRGVEQLNTSGQAGYVTLFRRGAKTLIRTEMHGVPAGRVEAVTIHRGRDCANVDTTAVARSGDLKNGRSSGIVPISQDRLLSGNYSVLIFSNTTPGARVVACSHLF